MVPNSKSDYNNILYNVHPVMGYYYSNVIGVKLCLNLLLNDTFYVGNYWMQLYRALTQRDMPLLQISFTFTAV